MRTGLKAYIPFSTAAAVSLRKVLPALHQTALWGYVENVGYGPEYLIFPRPLVGEQPVDGTDSNCPELEDLLACGPQQVGIDLETRINDFLQVLIAEAKGLSDRPKIACRYVGLQGHLVDVPHRQVYDLSLEARVI